MTNLSPVAEASPKQVTDENDLPVRTSIDKSADAGKDAVKPFDSHLPSKEQTDRDDSKGTDKKVASDKDGSLSSGWIRHPNNSGKDTEKDEKKHDEHAGDGLCLAPAQLIESAPSGSRLDLPSTLPEITKGDAKDCAKAGVLDTFPETGFDLGVKTSSIPSTTPKSLGTARTMDRILLETPSAASPVQPSQARAALPDNIVTHPAQPPAPDLGKAFAAGLSATSAVSGGPLPDAKPNVQTTATFSSPIPTEISQPNQLVAVTPAKNSSEGQRRPAPPRTVANDSRSFPSEEPSPVDPETYAGTDVARQHPKMSASATETIVEQIAPSATSSTVPVVSVPRLVTPSPARDFSSKNRETHSEILFSGAKAAQTGRSSPELSIVSGQETSPIHGDTAAAKLTHVFNAIADSIESLHSDGQTNVEVKLKLPDGEQLTVKLQLHAGEVHAIFRTDSTEWRQAITRGWSDIATNSAERGIRLTNPVFESPGTSAGFDNLNQHPRHDQSNEEPSTSAGERVPNSKKKAKTQVSTTSPIGAPSPSRQIERNGAGLVAWA